MSLLKRIESARPGAGTGPEGGSNVPATAPGGLRRPAAGLTAAAG